MTFYSVLIMVLGGSGSAGVSEMLDAADPKLYFEERKIDYRVGALLEILREPQTKKIDQEKPQEIRKLLAARALGDLGEKAALPGLTEMAGSKRRFYGEHAKAAIAKIEGRGYTRPAADAQAMKRDLALLPRATGIVFQARMAPGKPADLLKAATKYAALSKTGQKAAELMGSFNRDLCRYAEKLGNARLEGMTIAFSGIKNDDHDMFLVILARGLYDSKAAEAALAEIRGAEFRKVGGTLFSVFEDDEWAAAAVSDELFAMVVSESLEGGGILEELGERLSRKPEKPGFSPALAALIERTTPLRLWGAINVGPQDAKEIPPLAPFADIIMRSERIGDREKLRLTFIGSGTDAADVKQAVADLEVGRRNLAAELEQEVVDMPQLRAIIDFLLRINLEADGKTATAVVEIDNRSIAVGALLWELIAEEF